MENIITYENLSNFAYTNGKLIRGDVRGIVLHFPGLGTTVMYKDDPADAVEYAEQNILYVIPYYDPWCWMNAQTVRFVDEIAAVLCEHYNNAKIVSSGNSMGGLCALVYTAYARVTPVACVANCPVCDLPFHYGERPDLPRTLYSAFGTFDGTLDEALRAYSPLHLANRMPQVPYTVFHCERDKSVDLNRHSARFVEAMRAVGRDVTFVTVPLRGHCSLSPEAQIQYRETIIKAL